MKNLDEVILGLESCIKDADTDGCPGCPYGPSDDYSCCVELMKDSLGYLNRMDDLRKDIWDRTNENHRLSRHLKYARQERDAAQNKLGWILSQLGTEWLTENGESSPDFPKEGM